MVDDIGDGRIYTDLREALAQVRECLDEIESKILLLSESKGIERE